MQKEQVLGLCRCQRYADGVSSTTNFGVLGESKGNNAVLNIGVYGKATLGQNNWAGYFARR